MMVDDQVGAQETLNTLKTCEQRINTSGPMIKPCGAALQVKHLLLDLSILYFQHRFYRQTSGLESNKVHSADQG